MAFNQSLIIQEWSKENEQRFKQTPQPRIDGFPALIRDGKIYISYQDKEYQLIPQEDRKALIEAMWKDPATTGGRDRLFARIISKYAGISRRQIMATIRTFHSWQQRQPVKKRKIVKPIITTAPDQIWQMDLLELGKKYQDNGYISILVIVDCFSKYIWTYPLKDKSADSILSCLQQLLPNHKPLKMMSDNGKEFTNLKVRQLLSSYGIPQAFGLPYIPQIHGQVERMNRTLRDHIFKQFLLGNRAWSSFLPDITSNMNSSINKTTGKTPEELYLGPRDLEVDREVAKKIVHRAQTLVKPAPKFHLGDTVKIALPRSTVGHQLVRWSNKTLKIMKVIPPSNPWEQEQYMLDNSLIYTGYDLLKV